MPAGLRWGLLITDWGFVLYWSVTALAAMQVIAVPPAWMFRDYATPVMGAWNWSFAPLDLLASLFGLAAVHAHRRGAPWRGAAIVSLALTSCAGLMAIAFWTLVGDFDLSWWAPNLALMLWPWIYLPRLMPAAG